MRIALLDLLLGLHSIPRQFRSEAMARAMARAHAAIRGTLPPRDDLDADSAIHVFRAALEYCRRAGISYSDMIAEINESNLPAGDGIRVERQVEASA
jgi:hypothetical protein